MDEMNEQQGSAPVNPQENQVTSKTGPMAIISLVMGIVGLLFTCCCPYLFGPLGAVAAVLGYLELKAINEGRSPQSGKGMAMAGMILGIIAAALLLILIVLWVLSTILGTSFSFLNNIPSGRFR